MTFVFSVSFFMYLLRIDQFIAKYTRESPCPYCRKRLHVSNWQRAGFGVPIGCSEEALIRHSFCCRDCRKRITPNSLRFMYYKRHATYAELILCALRPDYQDRVSQDKLEELLGIDHKKLKILRKWWRRRFGGSLFVKQESSFIFGLTSDNPPYAILTHFRNHWPNNPKKALARALIFLARYRTDRHWYLHQKRSGGGLGISKNISPFSMAYS